MTTKINPINTKHIYPDNNFRTLPQQSDSMTFDGRNVNIASPDENQKTLPKSVQRNVENTHRLLIENEFATLKSVIIGLGEPYQEDKKAILKAMAEYPQIPNTEHREAVMRAEYPTTENLKEEYQNYISVLERYNVQVIRPDSSLANSFDYTCPRDIGFVIGNKIVIANMSVKSRCQEFETVQPYIEAIPDVEIIKMPEKAHAEGGDVIVMGRDLLVGINKRTNQKGYHFIGDTFEPLGYNVVPVYHEQLHLDCCFNPLGLGHALVHSKSLSDKNPESTIEVLKKQKWVTVTNTEREHLAPNVLSIAPNVIVGRKTPHLSRINSLLRDLGYTVEEVRFDGVPATGGSFRCASMVLSRESLVS
ncbi:MAG: arginine deiminase family protein [Desulfobacula sp.]|jgi:N-dimethylarginine dimethylaminohydrolase|nr:arginine deiminase family protein [Desulfobacula sp.]